MKIDIANYKRYKKNNKLIKYVLTKGGNEAYNDTDESINLNRNISLLYLFVKESYDQKILW